MYNVSIPEISKEELLRRYEKIKPIVEYEGKKYFLREFDEKELTNISYIYDKKDNIRNAADMLHYIPCMGRDFECIHKYGYCGLFKPSIAEVLAQISEEDLEMADAFEIIRLQDWAKNKIVFDQGYHISVVRLYTYMGKSKKETAKIDN